jgi:hypothetical protein
METRGGGEVLDVVWAVLVIQGSITVLSTVEAVVVGMATGLIYATWPGVVLTAGGAWLALAAARGIRRRKRWARRVTLVAEGLVLVTGIVNLVLSVWLAGAPLDLVPTLTTIIAPIAVIVLLRLPAVRSLFLEPDAAPISPPAPIEVRR